MEGRRENRAPSLGDVQVDAEHVASPVTPSANTLDRAPPKVEVLPVKGLGLSIFLGVHGVHARHSLRRDDAADDPEREKKNPSMNITQWPPLIVLKPK